MEIVVAGYYGFGNLGDEAILAGLKEGLARLAPQARLTVISADPLCTEKLHGLQAVARNSPAMVKAISKADLFILGGGGLFQDQTSLRSPLYYLSLVLLARALGRRVVFYAQGLGPLRSALGRAAAEMALRRAQWVSVRDGDSQRWAQERGIGVRLTADPAFLLPLPPKTREKGNYLALSLRPWPGLNPGVLGEGIAKGAKALGLQPLFIPFQEMDRPLCQEVASLSGGLVYPEELSPQGALELLGSCRLLLGMRLHSLILGAKVGLPSVGLIYDPKVEAFLELIDRPGLPVTQATAEEIVRLLSDAYGRRETIGRELSPRVAALEGAAWQELEELLGREGLCLES
ncbi:MAG: polysaccharide pyruvyl transferase CsaB [Limnochordia bacterium]